jgi:hypothetical protein
LDDDHLRDDLAGSHIAFDAHLRGRLNCSRQHSLTADADRVAAFIGHKTASASGEQITPVHRMEDTGDQRLGDGVHLVKRCSVNRASVADKCCTAFSPLLPSARNFFGFFH